MSFDFGRDEVNKEKREEKEMRMNDNIRKNLVKIKREG